MEKICHIRGNKDYWNCLDVYPRFKSKKKFYRFFLAVKESWDEALNIPYLEFRKKIRDIVIRHMQEANYFTTILQDNQECKRYFSNNTKKNILFYQQDDDDLFLGLRYKKLYNGVNVFQYSCIDPLGIRRKKGFHIHKNLRVVNNRTRIQSNQCLFIPDEILHKDIINLNIWDSDHTDYDALTSKHGYFFYKHPISLQIYHLHSISLWKSLFNNGQTEYTNTNILKNYVFQYVEQLEEGIINNPKYKNQVILLHLKNSLQEIINLYKQLIN